MEIQEVDPLDQVTALSTEIRGHQKRLSELRGQLPADPAKAVQLLANEVCDTLMSLLADFSEATTNTLVDERDYMQTEIYPAVFPDGDPDDPDADDEEDSILSIDDSAELTALLAGYRTMLAAGLANLQPDADPSTSTQLEALIGRVDAAQKRIIEITEDDESPETPQQ